MKVSKKMLFVWFFLAGLILLFCPSSITSKIQFGFARTFYWPLNVSRMISLSAQSQQPVGNYVSRRKYEQLSNHLANVISQLNQEHRKVEKLSGIRSSLPLANAKLQISGVIMGSSVAGNGQLIINKGSSEGLMPGQFVIGDNSVIGRLTDVSDYSATVRLLTDNGSKLSVRAGNTEADALLHGIGQKMGRISLLPASIDIEKGDIVYAQRQSGYLPAPMIAGKISSCERDPENPLLWDITVRPVSKIESLKEVAVIVVPR